MGESDTGRDLAAELREQEALLRESAEALESKELQEAREREEAAKEAADVARSELRDAESRIDAAMDAYRSAARELEQHETPEERAAFEVTGRQNEASAEVAELAGEVTRLESELTEARWAGDTSAVESIAEAKADAERRHDEASKHEIELQEDRERAIEARAEEIREERESEEAASEKELEENLREAEIEVREAEAQKERAEVEARAAELAKRAAETERIGHARDIELLRKVAEQTGKEADKIDFTERAESIEKILDDPMVRALAMTNPNEYAAVRSFVSFAKRAAEWL